LLFVGKKDFGLKIWIPDEGISTEIEELLQFQSVRWTHRYCSVDSKGGPRVREGGREGDERKTNVSVWDCGSGGTLLLLLHTIVATWSKVVSSSSGRDCFVTTYGTFLLYEYRYVYCTYVVLDYTANTLPELPVETAALPSLPSLFSLSYMRKSVCVYVCVSERQGNLLLSLCFFLFSLFLWSSNTP